jgi:hypothetical protein
MHRAPFRALTLALSLFIIGFVTIHFSQQVAGQTGPGWVQLFNGKNFDGWIIPDGVNWRVEDGAMVADKKTIKGNPSLVSKTSYKDFQLYAEVWVSADANSGIYIRCTDPKSVNSKSAYEVNLYDNRKGEEYSTGAIVGVAAVKLPAPKAGGKWNTLEVTAKGPLMTVTLNGVKTSEGKDDKFASGPIGLQYGLGTIKFRKVAMKSL